MPPSPVTILVQAIALAGAAVVGGDAGDPRLFSGLLAFGAFNVALVIPGTAWVRTITIGAAVFALATSESAPRAVVGILAWLVWPPAMLLGAALGRETHAAAREPAGAERSGARARAITAAIIVVVACASLLFRAITEIRLQQTAALFVGLPAVMAIAVVYLVSPRSAIGVACKAVTVGLLVSLLFLGEGLLCVAMSAPLFFIVAVFVGAAIDRMRSRGSRPTQITLSGIAVVALLPMSLEGVSDRLSWNRDESIAVTQFVEAPADAVTRALAEPPRFGRPLPPYLRAGFPRPVGVEIARTDGRARWLIHLRGGEMRLDGQEPAPGTLVLDLEEQGPGRMRWRAVADDSHMTHFLQWRESIVEWQAIDSRTTRVTWTVRYRRGLDPAWYFGPWERYAVGLAAGYLIEAVATP